VPPSSLEVELAAQIRRSEMRDKRPCCFKTSLQETARKQAISRLTSGLSRSPEVQVVQAIGVGKERPGYVQVALAREGGATDAQARPLSSEAQKVHRFEKIVRVNSLEGKLKALLFWCIATSGLRAADRRLDG
jgi:hypothetical protein